MKLPDEYASFLNPSGQALHVRYHCGAINIDGHDMVVKLCMDRKAFGFAMGCVKDDDSTITWDARAMERETR